VNTDAWICERSEGWKITPLTYPDQKSHEAVMQIYERKEMEQGGVKDSCDTISFGRRICGTFFRWRETNGATHEKFVRDTQSTKEVQKKWLIKRVEWLDYRKIKAHQVQQN
jgi:hypothetical protein